MLIDEADALAQSREDGQMHHEDRAGVNALIRGVDLLNRRQLPVAVIMCTNRIKAIDPAIKRRASELFLFERPDKDERTAILKPALQEICFNEEQIMQIIDMTGALEGRDYGFTYSDITHRLFNALVMSAYPNDPIKFEKTISIVQEIKPTPPFQGG